jgi:hypothetical protein
MYYTLGTMHSVTTCTLVHSFVAQNTTDCNTINRTMTSSNVLKSSIFFNNSTMYGGESKIIRNVGACCAVGYTACWEWCDTCGLLVSPLSIRKGPNASGSFLMLNACATILEPLDPFVDHPLWHDSVPILHWYPSMHFGTWYTFSP